MLLNTRQFHLLNWQGFGLMWAISISFTYTELAMRIQSHGFNLTYCLKSSILLAFCFLLVSMIDQSKMCPSSISQSGLNQRFIPLSIPCICLILINQNQIKIKKVDRLHEIPNCLLFHNLQTSFSSCPYMPCFHILEILIVTLILHFQILSFQFQQCIQGRFNNYVMPKLPFFTLLPPPSHFVMFVHENPLGLCHAQHKHPSVQTHLPPGHDVITESPHFGFVGIIWFHLQQHTAHVFSQYQ